MYFKTIKSRMYTMILGVIIISAASIFIYLFLDLKHRSYESFESITQTINDTLVANISSYVYAQDTESMKNVIDSIKSDYIKNIVILDANGYVIASQNKSVNNKIKYHDFEMLKNKKLRHKILNTFELLDIPLGYVVVEENMNYYDKKLSGGIQNLIILILSLALLGILVMFYLTHSVTEPIYKIIKEVQNADENETLYFEPANEEEFRYLTQTIKHKHNAFLQLKTTLEDEVNHKTLALQKLNETLELKVDKAVKEVKTKEQMMQQQARLAQMGEMLSMIAHQWRQPLSAISSAMMVVDRNIEIEKYDLKSDSGYHDFLTFLTGKQKEIDANIQYLSTTIDDFRNFFNPYTKKEHISINTPIKTALKLIEASLKNKGIAVVLELNATTEIDMYMNEVMQVILNILKNASDALSEKEPGHKKITIQSYNDANKAVIEICNNGIKISKEHISKIFNPYFTTKDAKIGTGLGLYMSKNIIEEHHNGRIGLYEKGDYTCFTITFYA